jgi:hypothetical protein
LRDWSLPKVSWGVEVPVERLSASKRSIAVVAFEDVGWGVEVLVEGLLTAK